MARCRGGSLAVAALAGVAFTGDLMFWHNAIEAVGAGLATVLGNLQVIIVGFFAWLLLGERPSRATLLALPIVLAGVILISGVVGSGAYGANPQLGRHPRHRHGDLLLGLPAAHPARVAEIIAGRPARWPSRRSSSCCARSRSARSAAPSTSRRGRRACSGWRCSVSPRSRPGYLFISISLPRLPAIVTSIILLSQPVMSMGLAMVLLGETPSSTQLFGVVLVIGGITAATIPVARLRDGLRRAAPAA